MSGLTCQQIVFVTKLVLGLNRSAVCALGSTPSPLTTWTDQLSFGHLICDGINADGGYTLASRVSADFPESDLLQFLVLLSISASCSYGFSVFTSSPLNS